MRKDRSLKKRFLLYLIPGFILYIGLLICFYFLIGYSNAGNITNLFNGDKSFIDYIFNDRISLKITLGITLGLFISYILITYICALIIHTIQKEKYQLVVNSKNSNTFGESKFLIDDRKNISENPVKVNGKEIDLYSFNKNLSVGEREHLNKEYPLIAEIKEPGFLVRNVVNPKTKKMVANISQNKHVKVLGVSRSGKTDYWVKPNAMLLADLPVEKKPNLFFTDPKGELYNDLSGELAKKGYEILVLNLNETSKSMGWQPLKPVYDYLIKSINFEKEEIDSWIANNQTLIKHRTDEYKCFEHEKKSCDICFQSLMEEYNDFNEEMRIYYDKKTELYFSKEHVKNNFIKIKKREYKENAEELVNSITFSLFPPSNDLEHKTWVDNPRNIVKGLIFLMMEIIEKNPAAITLEQFNMINVAKILSNRNELLDWYNTYASLEEGMLSRSATELLAPLNARESTTFFNGVAEGLNIFNYLSMQEIFSKNEIDFNKIFEKPTAIFLILPVRSVDKHPLGSLFISQCLDISSKYAEKSEGNKLPRKFFFFLDEIGNMPRINGLETTINVGMSQGFNIALIIQTNTQLKDKYGNLSETILNSIQLDIYIKATDVETINSYVTKAGKKTVYTKSKSYDSKINYSGKFVNQGSMSESEVSLITADQIMGLKRPLIMVFSSDASPMISYLTPAWYMKDYLSQMNKQRYISYSTYKINKKIESFVFDDKYSFNLFKLDAKTYGAKETIINQVIIDDDNKKVNVISKLDYKSYVDDLKTFSYFAKEKPNEITFEEMMWFLYIYPLVVDYQKYTFLKVENNIASMKENLYGFYNDNIFEAYKNNKRELKKNEVFKDYLKELLKNKEFQKSKYYKIIKL